MTRTKIGFMTALLLAATVAFVSAQEPQDEPKAPKQEEPRAPRQEQPRPEKQEMPKPETPKDQSKPAHQEKGQAAEQGHAHPAGKSTHIPDAKFKASFGRPHAFSARQVINTTTVVAGQTQFVYRGYNFIILDPWPSVWLFTDDCYVDFIDDEYFLFDVAHPGIRIALFVEG